MSRKPPTFVQPDPFRFGWRFAPESEQNGSGEPVLIPLTPEDVLHPRENDQIPENTLQMRDRAYLLPVLEERFGPRSDCLVLSDVLIHWGVPRLRDHSPDLVVFEQIADRDRNWTTFYVAEEGARPLLVIEIVSVHDDTPRMRDNDVVIKSREYFRAGVPFYVIVDQEEEEGPRRLLAFRRGPRRFVSVPPDDQGRVFLESAGVLLGLRDNKAVCFDAATGEEIPNYTELTHARQQAERARAAEAHARQQAEQARAAEAQARQQAEAALAAAQARIQELEAQARPRRRPRRRS